MSSARKCTDLYLCVSMCMYVCMYVCVCLCKYLFVCMYVVKYFKVYLRFVYRDLSSNPLVCGCNLKGALCDVSTRYVSIRGTCNNGTGQQQLSSFLETSMCGECDGFQTSEYKFIISPRRNKGGRSQIDTSSIFFSLKMLFIRRLTNALLQLVFVC